jgi:hypothetical protein
VINEGARLASHGVRTPPVATFAATEKMMQQPWKKGKLLGSTMQSYKVAIREQATRADNRERHL